MREILFRGKRIDNGEWVEGYLYEHEPPLVGIAPENYVPEPSKWFIVRTAFADWNLPRQVEFVQIDRETVGQFTGLTDKNGKRIFEGDILVLRTGIPYIVKFEDGGFVLTGTAIPIHHADKFEVIGNIHGNPELLNNTN